MKTLLRLTWLATLASLCLALTSSAVATTTLYNNGGINGDINAYYINYGYSVSDSFTVNMSAVTQVVFGVWLDHGDAPNSISWSIGTTPYGNDVASGTATGLSTNGLSYFVAENAWGYDIWEAAFRLPNVPLGTGTYYLTLQNATTTHGSFMAWDENDGPSLAYQTDTGAIGSEPFQVLGNLGGPWVAAPRFPGSGAGAAWLMTDGTVIVHEEQSNPQNWWKLTPSNTGSYVAGTWSRIASPPAGYAPMYFGSAVLPDGRLIIEGGEYNNGSPAYTNLGAIYEPRTGSWRSVAPPVGWGTIGDGQSIVLPNGSYMQANCCTTDAALLNPSALTWTPTGSGKADENAYEAYTLLPNGKVQTVDTYVSGNRCGGISASELYTPATGSWVCGRFTPSQLWDNLQHVIGPAVLRPDGKVFQTGGVSNTAIYNYLTDSWAAGPTFPHGFDVSEGPAALETNGKVLVMTSPGTFENGAAFFEFDGTSVTRIAGPPDAATDSSFAGHMLELPNGQILFTDFSRDVEIFTPSGSYNSAWAPTITSAPTTVTHGRSNYSISGLRLAGMSQGASYGSAYQSATNYALVRLTNIATHHVVYARTHNPSSYQVQSASTQSTQFDVPAVIDLGPTTLEIVTNGIPSSARTITVN